MKKKKKVTLIAMSMLILFLGASLSLKAAKSTAYNSSVKIKTEVKTKPADVTFSKETDYPIAEASGVFYKLFSDLKDLYQDSQIVAEVVVKDQKIVPVSDTSVSTLSEVTVSKVFKGDQNITSLVISEFGGPVDLSTVREKYKDKPGDGKVMGNPGIVEQALEGSPPMKTGNTYIVFVKKNDQTGNYHITGSIQGKVKIDMSKNKAVTTVDEHHLEEKTFFLQKQFAGKDKNDIIQAINSIK